MSQVFVSNSWLSVSLDTKRICVCYSVFSFNKISSIQTDPKYVFLEGVWKEIVKKKEKKKQKKKKHSWVYIFPKGEKSQLVYIQRTLHI